MDYQISKKYFVTFGGLSDFTEPLGLPRPFFEGAGSSPLDSFAEFCTQMPINPQL